MHCSLSKYRAVCDNRRELAVNNGALRKSSMLTTAVRVTPRTANVRAGVATLHKRPLIVDVAGIAHAGSAAIECAMRRETGVAAFFGRVAGKRRRWHVVCFVWRMNSALQSRAASDDG